MVAFGCATARRAHADTPAAEAPAMNARRLTHERERARPFTPPLPLPLPLTSRSRALMGFLRARLYVSADGSVKLTGARAAPRLWRHDHAHRDRHATTPRHGGPAHLRPVRRAPRPLHLRRHLRGGLEPLRRARLPARRHGGRAAAAVPGPALGGRPLRQ